MISARSLSVRFGAVTALHDLSLSVEPGSVHLLAGPNGAGKSTLLRVLMGLIQPDSGAASIDGVDCWTERIPLKRRIGYVPDEPLYPDLLTGHEVLSWTATLQGVEAGVLAERGASLLESVGLTDAARRPVAGYSFGMRKRLMLACALIHGPSVLLLDEPAAGLDPPGISKLNSLLLAQAKGGATVLLSSHLLPQAEPICTRVTLVAQGRVVASGSPSELRVAARLPPDAPLDAVFAARWVEA